MPSQTDTGETAKRLLRVQQALSDDVTGFAAPAELLPRALETLGSELGFAVGAFWVPQEDSDVVRCTATWHRDGDDRAASFADGMRGQLFGSDKRLPGLVSAAGQPVWVADTADDARMPGGRGAADAGLRSVVAFPLRVGDDMYGIVELFATLPAERSDELVDFLRIAGVHLAQYLDRWSAHERLLLKERALNATVNGVVISDATRPGFPIVDVNPGFERLTGYKREEIIGRSCRVLQGPDSDPRAIEDLRAALEDQREVRSTILNYRRDGSTFWNEIYLSPVHENGRLTQYVGVQNDVTDQREAEDRVAYLAYHDSLTGLANRSLLARHVDRALERARLHGLQVALLFVDLDDFKGVNDKFGHAAGDELLRQVAARLEGATRASDLLARQGGDEFLVLLADIAGDAPAIAHRVAEEIKASLREPLTVEGRVLPVRSSIGVSVFPDDAPDGETLMRHADSAMYRAKRSGGRTIRAYSGGAALAPVAKDAPLPEDADEALDAILSAGAVRAVYQPIVELDGRGVVGWESLARGPEGSALARPDLLFAAAARTGRLAELDWQCRAAAAEGALDASLGRERALFVNVEPETLGAPIPKALEPLWQRTAEELDVVVEITERSLTTRPAELLHAVGAIRDRGWRVALDDVGADTRSLALMPLLRPDVIKLDLRLVQEQPSTDIAAIVNAVNAERERTGAVLLAEGIETERHLEMARAMGATLGQGWLFGRPGELDPRAAGPEAPVTLPRGGHATGNGTTPYEVVSGVLDVRRADKRLLLAISHHLENQALSLGAGAVVLSAFQDTERFTRATHRRYTRLAADAAFVAALGGNMDAEPAPGVRGASLEGNDGLLGEWSIAVLGPHFAGALVAFDLGDDGPDMERRFDFCLTYDRDLVVEAAAALMRRVTPLA